MKLRRTLMAGSSVIAALVAATAVQAQTAAPAQADSSLIEEITVTVAVRRLTAPTVGYVFSSRHSDEARAEEVLRAYVGKQADHLPVRLLKFQTGYRETQWVGNCVAVGLSAGFFEPLNRPASC